MVVIVGCTDAADTVAVAARSGARSLACSIAKSMFSLKYNWLHKYNTAALKPMQVADAATTTTTTMSAHAFTVTRKQHLEQVHTN